jgi:DNA (cytosine-5)-methyltransferase 1
MSLTVSDFFCGAGGSSTGISQVPGLTVKLALNHWQRAIETHALNHPDTDHACADIAHIRPEFTPRTNILWASPECTNHSNARGKKRATQDALFADGLPDEAAERSRATMWDVPRFAEYHQYDAIMTENVVEAGKWGPFPNWLGAMESLGYEHHQVYMNAMHSQAFGPGAPQSRDRMYVVFWRKGNPRPDFDRLRPYADCDKHGRVQCIQAWKGQQWGKYRSQYYWRCPQSSCRNQILEPSVRPAADAIDWALQGKRIGDRKKPLAAKSLARIIDGIVKYPAADNLLVTYYGTSTPATTEQPYSTFTTRDRHALVVPMRRNGKAKPAFTEPYDTFAAGGNHHTLVEYATSIVDDAVFRMIQPHEQMWGMDFPHDYTILGTSKERTMQAGNAVCPPAARDLAGIVSETLQAA